MPTTNLHARSLLLLCALTLSVACSGAGDDGRLHVGAETGGSSGGGAGSSGQAGSAGSAGSGGSGGRDAGGGGLVAHVQDPEGLRVDLVSVGCAGECVNLVVVAGGGNPPYHVTWSDGTAGSSRQLCPEADTTLSVEVSDTAIDDPEFHYDAQTTTAQVTAQVLQCTDAGTPLPPDSLELCKDGVSEPFLLIDAAASLFTTQYAQLNGTLSDYRSGGFTPTIVGQWQRHVDVGACTRLWLAADAAGTKPIGFDNYMVFELALPGAATERWYYGTATDLVHVPTSTALPIPMAPTVPGTSLDPAVPNPAPFGYAAKAIDLLANAPAGQAELDLSLYVLDDGGFGSTTAIWVIPE
jgi:hypothetical protein